jgi:hypothetical protein
VLIQHLPPESATATEVRKAGPEPSDDGGPDADPADASWSGSELLLAAVHDRLAELAWLFVCANTPEGEKRPERPEPIRRPGIETSASRMSTREEIRRFFRLPGLGR